MTIDPSQLHSRARVARRLGHPIVGLVGLLVLMSIVGGCATTEGVDAKWQTWTGRDLGDLTALMGPPSSSSEKPNGRRLLTWTRRFSMSADVRVRSVGGPPPFGVTYADIGRTTNYRCDFSITVDKDDRIVSKYRTTRC